MINRRNELNRNKLAYFDILNVSLCYVKFGENINTAKNDTQILHGSKEIASGVNVALN
jgi:hypothetical protein